jgi:hypothetical protein
LDQSNIAHFTFSLLIPVGLAAIIFPFARSRFSSWPAFFVSVVFISFFLACAKEFIDAEFSINDIVSDLLGFLIGAALISDQYRRKLRKLRKVEDREVSGNRISLRGTLVFIEEIESRTANFYEKAAQQLTSARAAGLCDLLARDARKRSNRISFTLSNWHRSSAPEELVQAIERAFSSNNLFSLDFSLSCSPKEVLVIALNHEKNKLSLFSRLEEAFREEWKLVHLGRVLGKLHNQISKLEFCLSELEKGST